MFAASQSKVSSLSSGLTGEDWDAFEQRAEEMTMAIVGSLKTILGEVQTVVSDRGIGGITKEAHDAGRSAQAAHRVAEKASPWRDGKRAGERGFMFKYSSVGYDSFILKMKDHTAFPLRNELQKFCRSFMESVNRPGREEARDMVQDFIEEVEDRMASHPLWSSLDADGMEDAYESLEKYVIMRLHTRLFAPDMETRRKDSTLRMRIAKLQFIHPDHLDVPPACRHEEAWRRAIVALQRISQVLTPKEKIDAVLEASEHIYSAPILNGHDRPVSADEYLPILVYVLLRANPPELQSNIDYISSYRGRARMVGEGAYFFTHLAGAVFFIETLDASRLSIEPELFERLMQDDDENIYSFVSNESSPAVPSHSPPKFRLRMRARNLFESTAEEGDDASSHESHSPPRDSLQPASRTPLDWPDEDDADSNRLFKDDSFWRSSAPLRAPSTSPHSGATPPPRPAVNGGGAPAISGGATSFQQFSERSGLFSQRKQGASSASPPTMAAVGPLGPLGPLGPGDQEEEDEISSMLDEALAMSTPDAIKGRQAWLAASTPTARGDVVSGDATTPGSADVGSEGGGVRGGCTASPEEMAGKVPLGSVEGDGALRPVEWLMGGDATSSSRYPSRGSGKKQSSSVVPRSGGAVEEEDADYVPPGGTGQYTTKAKGSRVGFGSKGAGTLGGSSSRAEEGDASALWKSWGEGLKGAGAGDSGMASPSLAKTRSLAELGLVDAEVIPKASGAANGVPGEEGLLKGGGLDWLVNSKTNSSAEKGGWSFNGSLF